MFWNGIDGNICDLNTMSFMLVSILVLKWNKMYSNDGLFSLLYSIAIDFNFGFNCVNISNLKNSKSLWHKKFANVWYLSFEPNVD